MRSLSARTRIDTYLNFGRVLPMHQLVLITAMATTTGLFGGGKHCGKSSHCGRRAVASSCYSASPCGATTYAAPQAMPASWPQGTTTSPQMVPAAPPAPGKMAPPAPPTPATSSLVPNGRPFEPRAGYSPIVVNGNLR